MKDLEKRLAWLKDFKAWTEAGELDKMIQGTLIGFRCAR